MSSVTIKEAALILSQAEKILLLTHIRPDGDTLGSAFALKHALQACGHTVNVVCDDKIPQRLHFITEGKESLSENEIPDFKPDLVCAVDCAELDLMGGAGKRERQIDLKIDHHPNGSHYAKANHIDGSRASCGEIIFEVIRALEELGHGSLTPESADALYSAVSSDTGCFKYSNVTSSTMRIAADLIDAGAKHDDICKRLFDTVTKTEVSAQKMLLNSYKLLYDNKFAVITVSNEMKKENGISDEDLGGLGSYLREIEGVELSVVIKQSEKDPRSFRVSARSGALVSAADICKLFSGGGHARAAGASLTACSPDEAEKMILQAVKTVTAWK